MTSYSLHQRQYSSRQYEDRKLPNLFRYEVMSLTLLVVVSYVNIIRFSKKETVPGLRPSQLHGYHMCNLLYCGTYE